MADAENDDFPELDSALVERITTIDEAEAAQDSATQQPSPSSQQPAKTSAPQDAAPAAGGNTSPSGVNE